MNYLIQVVQKMGRLHRNRMEIHTMYLKTWLETSPKQTQWSQFDLLVINISCIFMIS